MKPEGIDKDDKSEILGEIKHVAVDFQPEVTGQDTDKENEGDSERNSEKLDFPQIQACRTDQRKHYYRLYDRRFEEYFPNKIHCPLNSRE